LGVKDYIIKLGSTKSESHQRSNKSPPQLTLSKSTLKKVRKIFTKYKNFHRETNIRKQNIFLINFDIFITKQLL